ncbi:hypothetical protein KY285_007383 [Solanum tuberosum]|nr:hypothetical protein KY285_007383 [Solanum tuberosum]
MEGDIIDLLLQLKKEQLTPIDLSLEDIKGIIMNVLLGGSDTSAAMVIWSMTILIKNPKAMKKVQEEIRNLIGNKGIVNEDDIQNMSYLRAVIKETLRLFPPIPLLIARESMKKSTLEGYELQPRTIVYVNAWAITRDPEIWENPEEFMPERFLNSDIDFKGQDYEFIPFGAGRRGCPAMALGVASVELALSNLLYAFDWELPYGLKKEDIDINGRPGITFILVSSPHFSRLDATCGGVKRGILLGIGRGVSLETWGASPERWTCFGRTVGCLGRKSYKTKPHTRVSGRFARAPLQGESQ